MKITKRQLKRIIKTASSTQINEWFLSKQKEDRLAKVLAGMRATDEERKKIVAALSDEDDSGDGDTKEKNEAIMTITKRQLRRIIKEEKARLLREQEVAAQSIVDTREHQWPSADGPISDAALDLATAWGDMEATAWSAGDPSMNQSGELSDTESKTWWVEQVDNAQEELEVALEEKFRAASIEVMQAYTDKLINGEFA